MANRLNPGIGERSADQRRLASSERFIGQFQKTRIIAKDAMGNEMGFEVLAILGAPVNTVESVGAFWGLSKKSGDTFLQGGTVSGGSGTKTIADIKVLDRNTVAGTLVDKILWVEITVNGVTSDGVLLPGANVVSVQCSVTSTVGKEMPSNTLPTASSTNGKKVFVELGRWTKDGFFPSKQGHIQISFCPGSFTITR